MKIALPMRMTRSERVKMRVPPAGPLPAGDTPTTDSGTYGSSQRSASRVVSRGERDDSVVVCAAAVHHAGSPRLLVHEQVEVVSEQFHLEQCVVDGHRFAVVLLLPHDVPRLVVVLLDGELGDAVQYRFRQRRCERVRLVQRRQAGCRGSHRDRSAPAAVYPAPVGHPPQPAVELGDGEVEGAVEVAGTGLGTNHRSAGDAGDLQTLAVVGLTRVAFVEKLDVDSDDLLVVALDLVELLADVYAVVIGHLDVAALDDDVHALTSPTVVLRVDR